MIEVSYTLIPGGVAFVFIVLQKGGLVGYGARGVGIAVRVAS